MKDITAGRARTYVKTLIGITVLSALVVVSLTVTAESAQAQTFTTAEREALIEEINELVQQINYLQALLTERRQDSYAATTTYHGGTYQTIYYNNDVETILPVRDARLMATASASPRPVDTYLFNTLLDTLGSEAVGQHIREFRVFVDDIKDIGAFIELKAGTDEWIIGVNRNSYDEHYQTRPEAVRELYTELFIHEYAHILAFYNDEITDDFKDRFWDGGDWRHARSVEDLSGDERFEELSEYYYEHEHEFVSDYATLHPDEDLAETFVEYVFVEQMPDGNDEIDQKIRFLDDYAVFENAREDIRDQLGL